MAGLRKRVLKRFDPQKSISSHDVPQPKKSSSRRDVPQPPKSSSSRDVPQPLKSSSSGDIPPPHKSGSSRRVPKPQKSSSSRDIPPPHKSGSSRRVPKRHKSSGSCDIPQPQPHVLHKGQTSFRLQDEELPIDETMQSLSPHLSQKRVLDSSFITKNQGLEEEEDHEPDCQQIDTDTSDPQEEENIGSNLYESRAVSETRKRRLNKGKLIFEVDECAGRIIGEDSQRFITKGGSVMREYAKFDGTTWRKQPDLLKTDIITTCMKVSTKNKRNRSMNEIPPAVGTVSIARIVDMKKRQGEEVSVIEQYKIGHFSKKKNKMVNEKADEIWNELQSEQAYASCSPAEICLKKLRRIPGHIKGRSTSTKQILATENLRMELELEKKRSKALEEDIRVIKEEQIQFREEQMKYQEEQNKKMDFMIEKILLLTGYDLRLS